MNFLRRAASWLFTIAPSPRYHLFLQTIDGDAILHFAKLTKRQAERRIAEFHAGGILDETPKGYRWIPPARIKRIDLKRINPNG
jgi:hypothetical protein